MKKGIIYLLWIIIPLSILFLGSCQKEDETQPEPGPPATEFIETERYNDDSELVERIVTIKDHGQGTGTMTFTSDKTWIAEGLVFVNEGNTLTVEPGTIIKGKSGQGENASAFVIARGGKVMAEGNAQAPIIFTAEADGIHYDHAELAVVSEDNIPPTTRGLWGGLIILGKATTNNTTEEKAIEGIPTTETRGLYGGSDDNDNSGSLKYVSIRYGGTDIGEGNEINGLTLGAVGSGTSIDYVEVISNKDDGFEWFGGTVVCKHLVSAFNGDDSFDYDEGFKGMGQYWFVVQDPNTGDRIGEHDGGPKDNEFGEPYSKPLIYNVTYIGRGTDKGKRIVTFRDNSGGIYANSIFVNQEKGIDIEWLNGSDCSYFQWADKGNLEVKNNIFWEVADGTAEGIFKLSGDEGYATDLLSDWQNYFDIAQNSVYNPGFSYVISTGGGLNPVPTNPAVTENLAVYPNELEQVTYKGAFNINGSNWMKGWTLLDHAGFLD